MEEAKPVKVSVYNEFVDVFAEMMANPRAKPHKIKAMGERLSRIGMKLFILAPDDVVHRYLTWRALAMVNEDPKKVLEAYVNTLMEMRKDVRGMTELKVETGMDLMV